MGERLGISLSRFILEEQKKHPGARGEFSIIMEQLAIASQVVRGHVRKAGLVDILGFTGKLNIFGERVQRLDELSNRVFMEAVKTSGRFCAMASEEIREAVLISNGGEYVITFDPLDGSSNIDINLSIGTIFSILKRVSVGEMATMTDLLQPGYKQIAAGYIIYGSSTMFVYTTGYGTYGFTYDPAVGTYLLSHEPIRIPEKGKLYSVNEGNCKHWTEEGIRKYIDWLKEKDEETKRPYSMRYVGCMVADVHRTLLKGGIFMYPADKKNPNGKLRLLYEANPMGFIVEQAGGMALTGRQRILDVVPETLHQRVPVILGSPYDVKKVVEFIE
jgi:fructose-1,6-bisphosphatase I